MDLESIKRHLTIFAQDTLLHDETNFSARQEALDFVAMLDETARLRNTATADPEFGLLVAQAHALRRRLRATDARLVNELASAIRSGTLSRSALRRYLNRLTGYQPDQPGRLHLQYEGLDLLLNKLFDAEKPPAATRRRDDGMIHYEPTPASVILELVDQVQLTSADRFFDLGAGLGQVSMLVALLTGCRAVGVEFEPAYVERARTTAARLGLTNVEFHNVDARQADYEGGILFFMFTPFRGGILATVLDRLRERALNQPLSVATYGACTLAVARCPWLYLPDPALNHEYTLAIFHST